MEKKKASPAKVIGIIFCILTVAVMVGIFVISADLRGCKKALDNYFGGISRGNYSAMNSALVPELRSEIPAEEQESYMAEKFGKYVGTVDNGVRITYSVKGMISTDDVPKTAMLSLEVRAKGHDFDERGNVMAFLSKVKGKWYITDVKVA